MSRRPCFATISRNEFLNGCSVGHVHCRTLRRRRSDSLRGGHDCGKFFRAPVRDDDARSGFQKRHRYFASQSARAACNQDYFVVEVHKVPKLCSAHL